MDLETIRRVHERYVGSNYGTLTPEELAWLQGIVLRFRPQQVLEVGMASGFTTGLLAAFLDEHGGQRVVSIDHDNTFFGDPSKQNGFLVPEIYPSGRVAVDLRPFTLSSSVPGSVERYDLAFVDANHQHPWPLIDVLCVLPALVGPRVLLLDDVTLYQRQDKGRGIGPKYVYDQFPDSHRERAPANGGNLVRLSLDLPDEAVERIAFDALAIPWTLTIVIDDARLESIRQVLRAHYGAALAAHFDTCATKYNHPTGSSYGTPKTRTRRAAQNS